MLEQDPKISLIVSGARDDRYAPTVLTFAERRERQAAVDRARANVRLEGFIPSEKCEHAARRYIAGEIDIDGFLCCFSRENPNS